MKSLPPQILIVSRWLGKDSEPWLHRQISGLTRYRASVAVEAHLHKDWYPGVRVTELVPAEHWRRRWKRLRLSLRHGRWLHRDDLKRIGLTRALEQEQPRLLHVHFLWNHYAADVACTAGVPVIVTAHGSDVMRGFLDSEYRTRVLEAFARATRVIAVSDFIAERLRALGFAADKIITLPLGAPMPQRLAVRQSPGEPLQLLSIGSLRPIKGHESLLRAFALALRRRPELCLTIVGHGERREELERLIQSERLQDSVTLTGALPAAQVEQLLERSHLYVQMGARLENPVDPAWPSEEGLGISYVEAAAHGLPLIGTNAGGVPEICRPGQSGLLVQPGDVVGMADAIVDLAHDLEMRMQLGEGARRLVADAYDQERQLGRLEDLYDEVLGRTGSKA